MSNVEEAANDVKWNLTARLINKLLFIKRNDKNQRIILLNLVFMDQTGVLFEIKTWREIKAFTVNRKVTVGQTYIVRGTANFKEPNKTYSTAKFEAFDRWFVDTDQQVEDFVVEKPLKFSRSLQKTISVLENRVPDNIMAKFVSLHDGPAKGYKNKKSIQGYYAKFEDNSGRPFLVLLWHLKIASKFFPLFDCNSGDQVLLTNVRSGRLPAEDLDLHHYTLTSLYPPLPNPTHVLSTGTNGHICI